MFSYISGKIRSVRPTDVIIDNNGLGYQLMISLHTYSKIKDQHEIQLYTYCIIKNETQATGVFAIYGFADEKEREVFMDLISVSGVGNTTAQLILSSFEPGELLHALASGNVAALQKVKGIGSKTAQRIIIDLRDKSQKKSADYKIPLSGGNTLREESLSALLTLGFSRIAAEKAVDKAAAVHGPDASVEIIIKSALTYLSS